MTGFLFVDQITELKPGTITRGVKYVTNNDVYCMDVNGDGVFWPALIGETLGQLCAWNVMFVNDFQKRPVAGMCRQVNIHADAKIGDTIDLFAQIQSLDDQSVIYNAAGSVKGKVVFEMINSLGPLLPMTDFIDESDIRAQFAAIYPGQSTPLTAPSQPSTWIAEGYDRITSAGSAPIMTAEKNIDGSAPYFRDHFPKKPVLPLTVLLQCYSGLALPYLKSAQPNSDFSKLRITGLSKIKMSRFIEPGCQIESQVKTISIDAHHAELEFSTFLEQRRICVARAEFTF